jgi:hypothetical protein
VIAFDSAGLPIEERWVSPARSGDAAIFSASGVIDRLELHTVSGELIDVVQRTSNAPSVTISAPVPGSTILGSLNVAWSMTDADGGPLVAAVDFVADNGSITPLLVRSVGATSISATTDSLPYASNGRVRVTSSDGLNWTTVEVYPLTVGVNHAPKVRLVSPTAGIYPMAANLVLRAQVTDLEDESLSWLSPTSVVWSSSIQGTLGTGYTLNVVGLSSGIHDLSATVIDSGGVVGSASVTVQIQ